jgi:hypothetical protein
MDNLCARLLQAAEILVETHAEELRNTLKSYSTVINLTDLNDLIYLTDLYDLTGDLVDTHAEVLPNTLKSYSTVINLTDLTDLIYLTDLYDLTRDFVGDPCGYTTKYTEVLFHCN